MENQEEKIQFKQIIWYFIIFSVIGLIIETIFCYVTTGVIESRKGLIWGPFCPVYGVGATLLIILLNPYKNKPLKLFIMGSILGNAIEYFLSFLLEAYYGTRFWDYSYLEWNLNGRICILYSIYWGILSFILIKFIKSIMDKFINKIPNSKSFHIAIITALMIDVIATIWAITSYQDRIGIEYYHKELKNEKSTFQKIKNKIEETLFSDEIMVKTFPNLRYTDQEGNQDFIKSKIEAN